MYVCVHAKKICAMINTLFKTRNIFFPLRTTLNTGQAGIYIFTEKNTYPFTQEKT